MKKALLAFGVAGVLTYSVPTMPVKAVSVDNGQTYSNEIQPRTEGLIVQGEMTISSYSGKLRMNGSTISNNTMKSIGFKDIKIQRSSDGDNWSTEKTLDDMLLSSTSEYWLTNYNVSVEGGYFYRVTCTHYAKESGLFGSSQNYYNTSNIVWIS